MSQLPQWLPLALSLADFPDLDGLEAAAYSSFQSAWTSFPIFRDDEVRVHRNPTLPIPTAGILTGIA